MNLEVRQFQAGDPAWLRSTHLVWPCEIVEQWGTGGFAPFYRVKFLPEELRYDMQVYANSPQHWMDLYHRPADHAILIRDLESNLYIAGMILERIKEEVARCLTI